MKIQILGSGAYGEVRLTPSGDARKEYNIVEMCSSGIVETGALSYLRDSKCPGIVELLTVDLGPRANPRSITMAACTPFMDKTRPIRSDHVASTVLGDILEALRYLHDHMRIAHRDIAPNNILISPAGKYILCDFGCASFIDIARPDEDVFTSKTMRKRYRRPEQNEFVCAKSIVFNDIWACYILLCSIELDEYECPQLDYAGMPTLAVDVCTSIEDDHTITAAKLLEMPYFKPRPAVQCSPIARQPLPPIVNFQAPHMLKYAKLWSSGTRLLAVIATACNIANAHNADHEACLFIAIAGILRIVPSDQDKIHEDARLLLIKMNYNWFHYIPVAEKTTGLV